MRGSDRTSGSLFTYVDLERRLPVKHPLRTVKAIVDDVLVSLDAEFERLYKCMGRPSISPNGVARSGPDMLRARMYADHMTTAPVVMTIRHPHRASRGRAKHVMSQP